MLYSSVHQFYGNFLKAFTPVLVALMFVVIYGCNQKKNKDFVKLDAPLEEVLPKITLIAEVEDGEPVEFTVGSTFHGKVEHVTDSGNTHKFTYSFSNQHVVEGNKYIFAVAAYNWGGSGTFHYLTAIDKTSLKSVSEVLLGDRVKTEKISLTTPDTDTVSITYMDRESGTAFTETPDKKKEKHFKMDQGPLQEVSLQN